LPEVFDIVGTGNSLIFDFVFPLSEKPGLVVLRLLKFLKKNWNLIDFYCFKLLHNIGFYVESKALVLSQLEKNQGTKMQPTK
jgi:hypothetical protein